MADPIPKYPLYDATYTAYRLSPLYRGANSLLDETTLRMHARRLRDILRGDILRGVDVGGGNADGSTSGTLENCTWELVGDEDSWERLHQSNAEEDEEQPGDLTDAPSLDASEARGIHIELRYQKATYTALLLRDPNSEETSAPPDFTALPLLFVRMPAALRDTFTTYLTSTFDARLAPMKLRSRFLSSSLETLLSRLHPLDPSSLLTRLQLQLSFPTACPTSALRCLDITLSRNDIPTFLTRGSSLLPTTPTASNITGPFTAALSAYLSAHLALDLTHAGVHISKIALPPLLALSADGRIKIFSPFAAASAAPDSGAVSVDALKGVADAFYVSLLRAARAAPVGEGVAGVGPGEEAVLVMRKGKGKERAGTKHKGKGKKRALGAGDANAGKRKAAEASPGKKRRRRRPTVEEDEEEEQQEEEQQEEDADRDESEVVASSASAGAGRLSVPKEPPPPYELHDPAIVGGAR